jgi:hypothetical protein
LPSAACAHLRLARLLGLRHRALVDAHDHLALLHEVADVEADVDHAARNLRRHGGLAHRLDHRLGGVRERDFAHLHRSRLQALREGDRLRGRRRLAARGGERDCQERRALHAFAPAKMRTSLSVVMGFPSRGLIL